MQQSSSQYLEKLIGEIILEGIRRIRLFYRMRRFTASDKKDSTIDKPAIVPNCQYQESDIELLQLESDLSCGLGLIRPNGPDYVVKYDFTCYLLFYLFIIN